MTGLISLLSKELSRIFSSIAAQQFESINSLELSPFHMVQLLQPYVEYWKNHRLDCTDFYQKSNVPVQVSSKEQVSFNFMAAVIICSDFGAQENSLSLFPFFPIYLPWSDGTGCHDLSFLNTEFCQPFPLSSFIFIKRLLSSSFFATIRVASSAYLRLLIFLLAILIPAGASFS